MRAQHGYQSTQYIVQTEESTPPSGLSESAPDRTWRIRNALASAVVLAVIGMRMAGTGQPVSHERPVIQSADWLSDLIGGLLGGGGSSGGSGSGSGSGGTGGAGDTGGSGGGG